MTFSLVLASLLTGLFTLVACAASAADRPSIVLIYADDLGYGDISCNGGAVATPNIDRLAREGLRFTDAHSSAATCTPSRYALLTGRYAFRQQGTSILPGDASLIISSGAPTLASVLRDAGYATGVVGKWHLGLGAGQIDWNGDVRPGPREIGFDYHYLMPATGDRVPCVYVEQGRVVGAEPADPIAVSYEERIDRGPSGRERPDLLKQRLSHGHDQSIVNGVSRIGWMTGGQKARWIDEDMADVLTGKATDFVKQHAREPFFLSFATHDVHVPRLPHARFAGGSGRGPRGDVILQLDWCVGEVLKTLDQQGLTSSTLVIFASDNGPVLDDGYEDESAQLLEDHDPNGDYRAGKYSLFEGGTRTPMLARWPGKIAAGEKTDALFGQVDLPATLASLAGAAAPAGAFEDSRDELDTLLGQDSVGRPHLVHEGRKLALRTGPWKYLPPGSTRDSLTPGPPEQIDAPGRLFDLSRDPAEKTDLAQEHPARVEEMIRLLSSIRSSPDGGR
ncbi:MAG: arylsulfatase [Pirellulales bacterium]|nr:arylsulfatase [Pirellulales bacterium]